MCVQGRASSLPPSRWWLKQYKVIRRFFLNECIWIFLNFTLTTFPHSLVNGKKIDTFVDETLTSVYRHRTQWWPDPTLITPGRYQFTSSYTICWIVSMGSVITSIIFCESHIRSLLWECLLIHALTSTAKPLLTLNTIVLGTVSVRPVTSQFEYIVNHTTISQ